MGISFKQNITLELFGLIPVCFFADKEKHTKRENEEPVVKSETVFDSEPAIKSEPVTPFKTEDPPMECESPKKEVKAELFPVVADPYEDKDEDFKPLKDELMEDSEDDLPLVNIIKSE